MSNDFWTVAHFEPKWAVIMLMWHKQTVGVAKSEEKDNGYYTQFIY